MICFGSRIILRYKGLGCGMKTENYDADRIEAMTDAICDGVLDNEFGEHYEFAMGFAAALDALAGGKVIDGDIVDIVKSAYGDYFNCRQFGEVCDFFAAYFKRKAFAQIDGEPGELAVG